MDPFKSLTTAVTLPFTAIFVVGLTGLINAMTTPGHWWFKWVALGMGIAVLVAWGRLLRLLLVAVLAALAARFALKWFDRSGRGQANAAPDSDATRTPSQ